MAMKLKDRVRREWNRVKRFAVTTALPLTILTSPLTAQATVGVDGTVKDKKQNPVENVLATYKSGNEVRDSKTTNSSGKYYLQWTTTAVADNTNIALDYRLNQNYPNPFNPSTTIEFSTLDEGLFLIYNILGQEVDRAKIPRAGEYTVVWSGADKQGRGVAAGLYIYSVQTRNYRETKKMVLLDGSRGGSPLRPVLDPYGTPQVQMARSMNKQLALSDTLMFEKDNITNLYLPVSINTDTTIDVIVNHGPVFEGLIEDSVLTVGDTLKLNLNDFFYNDDLPIYTPESLIVNDSLFRFITTQPETLENILVFAVDAYDTTLTDSSNRFSIYVRAEPNRPPVLVAPIDSINTFEDSLVHIEKYVVFSDPEGDALIGYVVNLPEGFSYADMDSTIKINSPENFYGTIESVIVGVTDGEFSVENPSFPIIYAAVNDTPVMDPLSDQETNEDVLPSLPLLDLHDYISDIEDLDSLLTLSIANETNPELVQTEIIGNRYLVADSLQADGSGSSEITVRVTDTEGAYDEKIFSFIVNPMTDLSGNVKKELTDEIVPIEGAVVIYSGVSDTTDASGNYHFQVAPDTSKARLVLTHAGHHERQTAEFAALLDTIVNETMVDTSFNMAHYDKVCRSREQALHPGTQRWETVPKVYVNTNPAPNPGSDSTEVTQAMIDTALSVISNLPQFAYQLFPEDTVEVEIGTEPPWGIENYIILSWDNTLPGAGDHGEHLVGNRIDRADARVSTGAGRSIYLEELTQNLGARNDSNIFQPSIFNTGGAGEYYFPVDLLIGRLLYTRAIGNLTPDTDP